MAKKPPFKERLQWFINNDFQNWLKFRKIAEDEISSKQSMFCVCGRLATGLHENGCRKFRGKVEKRAVELLEAEWDKIPADAGLPVAESYDDM